MLKPRKPVPALDFDTVGGDRWSLAAQKPQNFTMIVFYRGLHCPVCRRYTYLARRHGVPQCPAAAGLKKALAGFAAQAVSK
jgi:hypothetical protein